MTFTTPFETDKYTVFPGDAIFSNLSFAIRLIDDYTKDKPIGEITVLIKEKNFRKTDLKALKNLNGYYFFTDLFPANYTVEVMSEYYFPTEKNVKKYLFSDPEFSKKPVFELVLHPRTYYPFPVNTTLLRGLLVSSSGQPVVDAKVEVAGRDIRTKSDEKGEFVLYFLDIIGGNISINIEKMGYIKTINETGEGEAIALVEGKTIFLGIIVFL
ncbi:MAG: carboxypeptidase-like regulatory domain-containing protein [Methanosarcinaceae archaeon]